MGYHLPPIRSLPASCSLLWQKEKKGPPGGGKTCAPGFLHNASVSPPPLSPSPCNFCPLPRLEAEHKPPLTPRCSLSQPKCWEAASH